MTDEESQEKRFDLMLAAVNAALAGGRAADVVGVIARVASDVLDAFGIPDLALLGAIGSTQRQYTEQIARPGMNIQTSEIHDALSHMAQHAPPKRSVWFLGALIGRLVWARENLAACREVATDDAVTAEGLLEGWPLRVDVMSAELDLMIDEVKRELSARHMKVQVHREADADADADAGWEGKGQYPPPREVFRVAYALATVAANWITNGKTKIVPAELVGELQRIEAERPDVKAAVTESAGNILNYVMHEYWDLPDGCIAWARDPNETVVPS